MPPPASEISGRVFARFVSLGIAPSALIFLKLIAAKLICINSQYGDFGEHINNYGRCVMMVFQIQMTKRQGIVPVTRDYIAHNEARLRRAERSYRRELRLAGE